VGELTSAGSGAEPRPKTGSGAAVVHLELETTHLMETNFVFICHRISSHIHILLNIKLHAIFVPVKTIVNFSLPFVS